MLLDAGTTVDAKHHSLAIDHELPMAGRQRWLEGTMVDLVGMRDSNMPRGGV
jgi:hypothetical protein